MQKIKKIKKSICHESRRESTGEEGKEQVGCHVGANVRKSAKWNFAILSMYFCKFYISPLSCILTNLQIENELSKHENKQEKLYNL